MEAIQFIDLAREIQEDSRGFSFYPLKGRAPEPERLPEDFHLVSIAPGRVRGNHLHPGRWEWLYPFHGTGYFMWEPHPGDLRASFAKFYYDVVSPYLKDALIYLNVTQEGKQWITSLHAHVYASEKEGIG